MLTDKLKEGLENALTQLDVQKGDILYIASDIKTFLFSLRMDYGISTQASRNHALNDFVDILQHRVGEAGTLLFPVFSWEWCRGNGFHYQLTKGEVGTLSNWVLQNRRDFVRTKHPIYSFMVWGKDAALLEHMDNQDAWSHASPFHYLQTHGAKQLLFNIEAYQGFTFGHYIEQEAGVPYRHPKYFFGEYTSADGTVETRMYSMYVRDMDVEMECSVCNGYLLENGVATQTGWEGNLLTVIDLAASYPLLKKDMLENGGKNTLRFRTGQLDWSRPRTLPYEIKGVS